MHPAVQKHLEGRKMEASKASLLSRSPTLPPGLTDHCRSQGQLQFEPHKQTNYTATAMLFCMLNQPELVPLITSCVLTSANFLSLCPGGFYHLKEGERSVTITATEPMF